MGTAPEPGLATAPEPGAAAEAGARDVAETGDAASTGDGDSPVQAEGTGEAELGTGFGPLAVRPIYDTSTIEFAPGLRPPVSRGTPPPPPSDDLFQSRLGRPDEPPRMRIIAPIVVASLIVLIIGIGLVLAGGPRPIDGSYGLPSPDPTTAGDPNNANQVTAPSDPATPAPSVSTTTKPPTPTATTGNPHPTNTTSTPAAPTPTVTGPGSIPYDAKGFSVSASGFPCGAGSQLTVTIGGHAVDPVATSNGSASISFTVTDTGTGLTVSNGVASVPLATGDSVVAVTSTAPGCSAVLTASDTVKVRAAAPSPSPSPSP